MRYRAFRTKKDNQFYFQFMTDGGDTVLKSQAYADKNACFNGIRSVMENASNADRYQTLTEDGKHLFILKAGNNQEIARSVPYDSEADMNNMMNLVRTQAPNATSNAAGDDKGSPAPAAKPPEKAATKTNSTDDDYKPLAFYEARISGTENGFDSFVDSDDNEAYFTYNLSKMVVLISEGYSSEASRDNGIASVTKNLPLPERYQRGVHKNGKHFFSLRAGNNQEIATSRWFDSDKEMDAYISVLQSGGKGAPRSSSGKTADKKSGPIYKEYRPLAFYAERIEGTEFGYDAFADDDKYYFTVNHEGKPVLISEDYTSEAGRDNGIASVKKNVKNEARYVPMVHPNGMHYFNLLAGNKQEIATSRWFETKKEMKRAIAWLQGTGGTRRRKKAVREKKPAAERRYIEQGISYPCSEIVYDTFQSGGNERFYFVFKSKEGKAVLINGDVRGYENKEAMDDGIKQLVALAPHEKNYDRRTTKNGKHYFYVVNEDGKAVGRGSLFYAEQDEMEAAIKLLACGAGAAEASAPPRIDDYMVCEAYAGKTGGFNRFTDDASGEHYFSFNDNSGQVLLRSEGYTTEAARDNGIESVKKNSPEDKRWVTGTVLNGKHHYYALRAGNNQEIARSCYYDTEEEMNRAWALTKYDLGAEERAKEEALALAAKKAEEERLAAEKAAAAAAAAATAKAEAERIAAEKAEAERLAAEKKKEQEIDDYMPCEAYADKPAGFNSFKNDERGEYYFSYNDADGGTWLRSEGYTTESARDNGIESVKKNALIDERWVTGTVLNGKHHYFALRAGNNQEIARSCYYDTEADMMAAMKATQTSLRPAPKKEQRVDDYMPCEAYADKPTGFNSFKNDESGEYYFSYNDKDGGTWLRSEGYTTEAARNNGIESVKKNALLDERWVTGTVLNGKHHYYALRAGNNQEIARSCYFDNEAAMLAAMGAVKGDLRPKPKAEAIVDDYLPCAAYKGAPGFHTFKDEASGEYYFAYNDEDGNTLLRSEGYTTAAARDNGIESVKKNAPIEGRWKKETALNGKYHYHILRAGNNQEIARSCYHTDNEKLNTNFLLLGAAFAPVAAAVPEVVKAVAPPPKPKEKEDDYLPCREYRGHRVNDKQNNVALFKHDNGQFYFAIYNKDGSVRLRSEGFGDAKERDVELSGVLKNLDNKEMYSQIKRGDYTIHVLKDKTGREVGRSCAEKKKVAAAVVPPVVVPPPPPPKKEEKAVPVGAALGAAGAAAAGLGAAGGGAYVEKKEEKKEKGCLAYWPWLLLGLLALLALLYFMRGCEGCNPTPPPPPPPIIKDTTPPPPPPVKTALCPDAGGYKLAEGSTGAAIVEYLSDPESTYPKRFSFNDVGFSKNRARLNSKSRKVLDDLVATMKGCGNIMVDVYGYTTRNEKTSYRGSKEVSLDDARAKAVYDYLKSKGIAEGRLNHIGDGEGDSNNTVIMINESN